MNIVNTKVNNLNKKICLLADIHFNIKYNTKIFDRIIKNININKPDYICIVGDILDNSIVEEYDNMYLLYNFINELSKISKVIITLGNHDITHIHNKKKYGYRYPSIFVKTIRNMDNVIFLDNEKYVDDNICFIGYNESYDLYYNEEGLEKESIKELNSLLDDLDDSKYNVLLSHNPLYVSKAYVYNNVNNYSKLNLILSGHTHNGLLPSFIKTNTLLISPQKHFLIHTGRGYYRNNKVDVVVTGGVIKFSYGSGIFRYFNFLYSISLDYISGLTGNNFKK